MPFEINLAEDRLHSLCSLSPKPRGRGPTILWLCAALATLARVHADQVWHLETDSAYSGDVVLEGFDPANGWIVRPAGDNPAQPAALQKWRSLSRPAPPPRLTEQTGWQAVLGSEDRFTGVEAGLTEHHLATAGTYFGLTLIPRSRIRELRNLAAFPVYEGPLYGEEWQGGEGPYIAGERSLRVPAGRRLAASFEGLVRRFHWRLQTAPTVDFTMRLPAGDPLKKGAFYRLQRAAGAWTLRRTDPDGAEIAILKEDRSEFPDTAGDAAALWDVFADLDERRVWLFCDGQLVCDWQEPTDEDTPPVRHSDTILALLADRTAFEVRWFWLTPWRSAEPSSPDLATPETASDLITLANGDELRGEIRAIHRGTLSLKMADRPMVLPVSRVSALFFRTQGKEPASATPADSVRVKLFNGDALTVTPRHSTGDVLIADHGLLGECRLPLAEIRRIERTPPNGPATP